MSSVASLDPAPPCIGQLLALCGATARELLWGRRAVSKEIRAWKLRAEAIVDAPLRQDALAALTLKRGATDGAALFWTLLPRRDPRVLRLLVAHELIWDYLDCVSERWPDGANGAQLHRAIVESVDPFCPMSDYYRHHPWRRDGGFLSSLVETCRGLCCSLPSYPVVRSVLVREATRAIVQGINHVADPGQRDAALRRWATVEYPHEGAVSWFELAGAASAPLAIHALLALAGEHACDAGEVAAAYAAYFPWVGLATVMLDSYIDRTEDLAAGNHSYIAHYPSEEVALRRLHESIAESARGVLDLRNGHRHAVVIACMVAMYLSSNKARTPELSVATRSLAHSGGWLTRLLVPILRLWRVRYAQEST